VPTPQALGSFRSGLAGTGTALRETVVPAAATGPRLLLAFVATFVAAALTEVIARRFAAPVGAIGPSVALYIACTALGEGPWAAATAAYGIAIGLYLVALHADELAERRTWFRADHPHRPAVVAGGIGTVVVVVATALVVGPALPGAGGDALLDYRRLGGEGDGGGAITTENPFLSIASQLRDNSDAEAFRVRTSNGKAYYWRVTALDEVDGDTWTTADRSNRAAPVSALAKPGAPDGAREPEGARELVSQSFALSGAQFWLPAAYRPFDVDTPGVSALPGLSSLFRADEDSSITNYTVRSEVVTPTDDALRRVSDAALAGHEQDTKPGRNVSNRVRQEAARITADARGPYERALALEQYFQGDFIYDLDADYSGSSAALDRFVFEDRRGFCQQFAGAFAAMARSVGLPTRIAIGYQARAAESDGTYRATGADAHAWPEVWLGDEIGWYAFEPTKTRRVPGTGRGDETVPALPEPVAPAPPTTDPANAVPQPTAAPTTAPTAAPPPTTAAAAPARSGGGIPRALLLAVLVITLAVAAGAAGVGAVLLRARRRTRDRRDAPDPRRRVTGAWDEALDHLATVGVSPRPSATPMEFALRQAPAHGAGDAGPPLVDLARLQTAAVFAPEPPSDDEARRAWEAVGRIERAVRAGTTRRDRLRSQFRRPRRASRKEAAGAGRR